MRALLTLAAVAALAVAAPALAAETPAPMASEAMSVNEAKQVVRKMLTDQNSSLRVGTAERQGDTAVVTLVSAEGIPAKKIRIDLRTGQPTG